MFTHSACSSDLYQWTDSEGLLHFSEEKPPGIQAEKIHVPIGSKGEPQNEDPVDSGKAAPYNEAGGSGFPNSGKWTPKRIDKEQIGLPGFYHVSGRILFANGPFSKVDKLYPEISIRDKASNVTIDRLDYSYDIKTGEYRIFNVLPGAYWIFITFQYPDKPHHNEPGEYIGSTSVLVDSTLDQQDIDVIKIMRLYEPVDNTAPLPAPDCENRKHGRKLRLRWEDMGSGVSYKYKIRKAQYSGCNWSGSSHYIERSVDTNHVEIQLPPGEYTLGVEAFRRGNRLGKVAIHGQGWFQMEYYFLVE